MAVKDLIVRILVDDDEVGKKTDAAGKKFGKFGGAVAVGAGAAAGGLAILTGAAVSAVGAAVQVEGANNLLAGSLGLTAEQAKVAADAVSDAYEGGFGETREVVSAATEGIISSITGMRDASVDRLTDVTEKVLTISQAFEMESDRVSQIVGQMVSTGLVASAEQGLDLLTASLQKIPAAVRDDVLDAVDEYGPFFRSLGLSGEQAMSMLVSASQDGMYGIDKTGDALKELTIRISDMSSKTTGAFETIGLDARTMADDFLAGGERASGAFSKTVDGLLAIQDPVDRANTAIALFGTPLEDLSVQEIPAFLTSLQGMSGGLGDVSGAAEGMRDKIGSGLGATWESISRTFEGTAVKLSSLLLPMLAEVAEVMKNFSKWAEENPAAFQSVAVAIGLVAAAFGVMAAAMWVASLTPITFIVGAIALGIGLLIAAIVLLVMNWDAVWKFLGEAWQNFLTGIQLGGAAFADWWNGLWSGIGQWATGVWNGFIGWAGDVWRNFSAGLRGIGDGIASWWNGLWGGDW